MAILSYKDVSGNARWPDAVAGSEKYYGVDWDSFLTAENDTITSIAWTVPTGLTNLDDKQDGNTAIVKLRADTIGKYRVICEISTVEAGDTQLFKQVMNLEVV